MDEFKSAQIRLEKLTAFREPFVRFVEDFILNYSEIDKTVSDLCEFDIVEKAILDAEADDRLSLLCLEFSRTLILEEQKLKTAINNGSKKY